MGGDYPRPSQALQLGHEGSSPADVQAERGLIQQHDLRPHRQNPGQRDAPLLPAGKLHRRPFLVPPQDLRHPPQCLGHSLPDLLRGEPQVERSEGHVVTDGGAEELVVAILEDDADAFRQAAPLGGFGDVQTTHADTPRPRSQDPAQA